MQHVDVVIVGCGISGISAAYHLSTYCPKKSYAVLERRADLGGTWDLFKYPGIRSDSDMFTFGFHFKPWGKAKPIAPANEIKTYLHDIVQEFGIEQHIRYKTHVVGADWSSAEARWVLTMEDGARLSCSFLWSCGGYYDYDKPFVPEIKGRERFQGRVLHPQIWDEAEDYAGQRVAIIGSGATAITLLPNMAQFAKHTVMVQRSPGYTVSAPEEDLVYNKLKDWLPAEAVHRAMRFKNVAFGQYSFSLCRAAPEMMRKDVQGKMWEEVKDIMTDAEFKKHFNPKYAPWEQRVCVCPGGDFWECIRNGSASVVTGHIETFTERGLRMVDGEEVEADVVVTATGMQIQPSYPMSTMKVTVDGRPYNGVDSMVYRTKMLSGVPNFFFTVGYTHLSWTLRADMTSYWVVRMLNGMDKQGLGVVAPAAPGPMEKTSIFNLSSNYLNRTKIAPCGDRFPWKAVSNYFAERWQLMGDPLSSPELETKRAVRPGPAARL